jgi:hypothetical protein
LAKSNSNQCVSAQPHEHSALTRFFGVERGEILLARGRAKIAMRERRVSRSSCAADLVL